ncbi:hypothetical protein BT69DRAFT_1287997 [Atractiella rhizophila]|nr:hypothetical protein BT69DRAFT_1287997 [Atractiella rhizophila]
MPDLKFLKVETTVYIDEDIHSLVDSSPQLVHVQKLSLDLTTDDSDSDFDFDATERPPSQCLPVHDLLSLFSNLQALDLRGLRWDQNIFHILPTSLKKLQMHLDLNKVAVTPQTIRQVFLQQNKLCHWKFSSLLYRWMIITLRTGPYEKSGWLPGMR